MQEWAFLHKKPQYSMRFPAFQKLTNERIMCIIVLRTYVREKSTDHMMQRIWGCGLTQISFTNLQSVPAPECLCHISQNAIMVQVFIFAPEDMSEPIKEVNRDDTKTASWCGRDASISLSCLRQAYGALAASYYRG